MVAPATFTRTRARRVAPASQGSSCSRTASSPGFASPTAFSIPPVNSATRGAACPRRASGVTALVTIPPRASRSMTRDTSRPNPAVPEARRTGFWNETPNSGIGGREHGETRLLDAAITAGMNPGRRDLDQAGELCRFPQVFVQLEVPQDEPQRTRRRARRTRFEADNLVFHLRHALLIFRLRVREKVGLHAAHAVGASSIVHRVDVNAHEQIAVCLAESPAIRQVDQGVGGARERRTDSAAHQLRPQEPADGQGDVLLHEVAREITPGVAGIDAAVTGIDHHGMAQTQPGDRVRYGSGATWSRWRRRRGRYHWARHRQLHQSSQISCGGGLPAVAATQRPRHAVRQPVERQKHRVARHIRLAHEPIYHAAGAYERRPQLEYEHDTGETNGDPRSIEGQRESER